MSQKAIREFDGKLMLSKYLAANSCQQHSAQPRGQHQRRALSGTGRVSGEASDAQQCSRVPTPQAISISAATLHLTRTQLETSADVSRVLFVLRPSLVLCCRQRFALRTLHRLRLPSCCPSCLRRIRGCCRIVSWPSPTSSSSDAARPDSSSSTQLGMRRSSGLRREEIRRCRSDANTNTNTHSRAHLLAHSIGCGRAT